MMNLQLIRNRKFLIAIGIAVLAVLNIWRWWPQGNVSQTAGRAARLAGSGFEASDFEVRVMPDSIFTTMHRDLFSPKRNEQAAIRSVPVVVKPPEKTPEELAREAAQAELTQYRCAGVSVRGGRYQAFMVRGDQTYLVSPGDKVGNRFIVDKITAETVILVDPESGVSGKIAVSGR